jgi:hypothetical protein
MMILTMKVVIGVIENFVIFKQVFLSYFDINHFVMNLKNFVLFFQDLPRFLHSFSYFLMQHLAKEVQSWVELHRLIYQYRHLFKFIELVLIFFIQFSFELIILLLLY